MLLTAVEQGWPLSWLPGGQVAAALQAHGYDPRVTLHCLNAFGAPAGSSGGGSGSAPAQQEGDAMETEAGEAEQPHASASAGTAGGTAGAAGEGAYALDEAAVCLHFARKLLQEQPDWELARFEEAWQGAVPEVRRSFVADTAGAATGNRFCLAAKLVGYSSAPIDKQAKAGCSLAG